MTAQRQFDHSIEEIKAALNARAVELAHAGWGFTAGSAAIITG
jgi:hypothetical protein